MTWEEFVEYHNNEPVRFEKESARPKPQDSGRTRIHIGWTRHDSYYDDSKVIADAARMYYVTRLKHPTLIELRAYMLEKKYSARAISLLERIIYQELCIAEARELRRQERILLIRKFLSFCMPITWIKFIRQIFHELERRTRPE